MSEIDTHNILSVSCITNEDEFQSLRYDWNLLANKSENDNIFTRHEWFSAAWNWLKASSSLKVISIYDNKNIIGIIPLILKKRQHGILKFSSLEFFSVPDTQFSDIICLPSKKNEIIIAFFTYLYKKPFKWDVLELSKISTESTTNTFIKFFLDRNSINHIFYSNDSNPFIKLSKTWEDYYSGRTRRLKKGNNLVANKIKRQFSSIKICHYKSNTSNDINSIINSITKISSKSWKNITGLTLNNAGPASFFYQLTNFAYKNNWLSIWVLYFNEEPVAMEYQLNYKGNIYALRSDFDDNYSAYSPGTYLNLEILKSLFSDKNNNYYYMGPGENKYKLRWAEQTIKLSNIFVYNTSLKGRTISFLNLCVRPMIKSFLKLIGYAKP